MPEKKPSDPKKKAPKKPNLPNVLAHVAGAAHKRNYTLTRMSRAMGRNSNYLHQALGKGDPRIGLLLQLSEMLHQNLLEPYLALLPPTIGPTEAERELQKQVDDLSARLAATEAERDKYWQAILGRG
jgi:hypothetical protein